MTRRCTRAVDQQEERIRAFLAAALDSGEVIEQIVPLRGDASDRRYLRVFTRPSAVRPQGTYVVMVLERPWQPQDGMEELPFVNIGRYLGNKGLPVPELHYYDPSEGLLLLEDLGSDTLQRLLRKAPWHLKRRFYREAIDLLSRMQEPLKAVEQAGCYAARRAFTPETLCSELMFFLEHAVCGLWHKKMPVTDKDAFYANFMSLCKDIAAEAQVFVHRDYHSRNLMVKDGRIRLLDFQDARMGTIYYDLVSLLRDSYIALPRHAVTELLSYYRTSSAREGLVPKEEAEFFVAFDRTSIQRNLKAVGTFAYQACCRGRRGYLVYIPRTLGYVRATLARYKDLSDLARLLAMYVPGM